MPRSIRKTARATDDLIDIWQYSPEKWGEQRADDYLDELDSQIQGLLNNPNLGKSFDDVRPGYRATHVNRHMIFYTVRQTPYSLFVSCMIEWTQPGT